MAEFIKMTCRKKVNRRIRAEQKLMKVEALFIWLYLLNLFLGRAIFFALQFYLFRS